MGGLLTKSKRKWISTSLALVTLVQCGGGGGGSGGSGGSSTSGSSGPSWQWTQQLGQTGQGQDTFAGMAVDTSGNVFIGGYTSGNMPGCNGVSGACGGGTKQGNADYFLSKYNSSGVWQWTKQLGMTARWAQIRGIATDSAGNSYITGKTDGMISGCSGVSGACGGTPATGTYDYFLAKYSSAGVWQWSIQLGMSAKTTEAFSVAIDSSTGNILVAGQTTGKINNCNGVSGVCGGSNSQGPEDYFVSAYNSAGVWQWTKQLGMTGKTTIAYQVSTDSSGNVFVAGSTTGNITACGGVSGACGGSNSQGTTDYFISKYNSAGVWQWTKTLGETLTDSIVYGMAVDTSGNVYVGGTTSGNIKACNGVSGACGGGSSQGTDDVFISKYNSAGTWQWTKQLGQTGFDTNGSSLSIDASGNLAIVGYTTGNLAACNGVSGACGGVGSQGGGANNDYFVVKYDSSGNWLWTGQLGETNADAGEVVGGMDPTGRMFVGGRVTSGFYPGCNGVSGACGGTSSQGVSDYFVSLYQ